MPNATAWNGDVVAVPDQRQPAVARSQTIVSVRAEYFTGDPDDRIEFALACAVRNSIGDQDALTAVSVAWVTAVQWIGGAEYPWHAETPEEWADLMDGSAETAAYIDGAALGLLDNVLDWREGWPPETEGW